MLTGDCNVCINRTLQPDSAACVECGLSRKNYKPVTNADRIRAMTDEELADYFAELSCWPNAGREDCRGMAKCMDCWLDWLRREAGE